MANFSGFVQIRKNMSHKNMRLLGRHTFVQIEGAPSPRMQAYASAQHGFGPTHSSVTGHLYALDKLHPVCEPSGRFLHNSLHLA